MSAERAGRFVQNAYRLTEIGWALIPLEGKVPKGRDWQHTAPLRDPHQAAGLWAEWGKRWNMGVVLGPSGLCVVEYDRADAEPILLELLGGGWPETPTVRTGSGRRHLYFEVPPNGVVKAAREGLELRLGTHQCVLPPSEHPDTGREYVWEIDPWNTPLAAVPADVLGYFAEAADELRERLADPGAKVYPGQRRDQVFRLACSLVARGVPRDAILTSAHAFNKARCDPTLDDVQVVEQVDADEKQAEVEWGAFVEEHPELTTPSTFTDDELLAALRTAIESRTQPWLQGACDSGAVIAVLVPDATQVRNGRATPIVTSMGKRLARLAREGKIVRLRKKWTKGRGSSIWSLPGIEVNEWWLKQYEVDDAR